jgi:DNA-binding transcriptional regulator YhcF (GntR family)
MSEELINEIKYLAEEYQFNVSTIERWYEILSEYPCFDEENAAICLENLCQRRASCKLKVKVELDKEKNIYSENLKKSIENVIYTTYEEKAAPYLSEEFRNEKGIYLDIDKYNYDYPEDYQNTDDYVKIH